MILFVSACVVFAAVVAAAVAVVLRAIGTLEEPAHAPRKRRVPGVHARDRSARGFDWRARKTAAERIPEMAAPFLAAPLAPLPEVGHGEPDLHDMLRAGLAEAERGETITHDLPEGDDVAETGALYEEDEPEDPYDLLADEDLADAYVGPAEPLRLLRRQPGRLPPVAVLKVHLLVIGSVRAAAKARVTAYPEWPTGSFPTVMAELGALR